MAPTRFARRETLRDAVLRWSIPFCAVRTMIGSASFNAAASVSFLPESIASSTLRTELRMRLRRVLLAVVRRDVWRTAFFADFVLGMMLSLDSAFASGTERHRAKNEADEAVLYNECFQGRQPQRRLCRAQVQLTSRECRWLFAAGLSARRVKTRPNAHSGSRRRRLYWLSHGGAPARPRVRGDRAR